LEHLGEKDAADLLMLAIEKITGNGEVLTRDLGGKASTRDVTDEILKYI